VRNALSSTLTGRAEDPQFIFLTGDLGFNALEPLREAMGTRFINAGVAEQNMVSVAAGLAMSGLRPWVYSIAPFIYGRPFEQIRNDVCLHDLPVALVGNGGGYAYGVMGSTHHALEDYGVLLTLPNLRVYVPAFCRRRACSYFPNQRVAASSVFASRKVRNARKTSRCLNTRRGAG
jgi:transketolase